MRELIKHLQEADIFKPAGEEEIAQRKGKRFVLELIVHEPWIAIHPLGIISDDAAQEAAERLSGTDSSWIVVDEATLDAFKAKLNNLER